MVVTVVVVVLVVMVVTVLVVVTIVVVFMVVTVLVVVMVVIVVVVVTVVVVVMVVTVVVVVKVGLYPLRVVLGPVAVTSVCNHCLFSFPAEIEMAKEQKYSVTSLVYETGGHSDPHTFSPVYRLICVI